jgi:ribonuclease BN (tRNA processing enzyme)
LPRNGKEKLKVFGPEGTKKTIEQLFCDFCHTPGDWYEVFEISEPLIVGDMKILPYSVVHKDLKALAYRFEEKGKTIVFSGDSTLCQGIKDASKDADLFIVDASLPKGTDSDTHLNSTQIGQICRDNNIKKVVLSHLTIHVFDKDIISEVEENYNGEVELAQDLASFEI